MMKILWYLGRLKCKLGLHKTAGVQILWNSTKPMWRGTRLRCVRCNKIIKEESNDTT